MMITISATLDPYCPAHAIGEVRARWNQRKEPMEAAITRAVQRRLGRRHYAVWGDDHRDYSRARVIRVGRDRLTREDIGHVLVLR